jgi:lactobin A/cerein 7B family class IIb bacteriocin
MMENKFEMNKFAAVGDAELQEVDGGIAPLIVAGAIFVGKAAAGGAVVWGVNKALNTIFR